MSMYYDGDIRRAICKNSLYPFGFCLLTLIFASCGDAQQKQQISSPVAVEQRVEQRVEEKSDSSYVESQEQEVPQLKTLNFDVLARKYKVGEDIFPPEQPVEEEKHYAQSLCERPLYIESHKVTNSTTMTEELIDAANSWFLLRAIQQESDVLTTYWDENDLSDRLKDLSRLRTNQIKDKQVAEFLQEYKQKVLRYITQMGNKTKDVDKLMKQIESAHQKAQSWIEDKYAPAKYMDVKVTNQQAIVHPDIDSLQQTDSPQHQAEIYLQALQEGTNRSFDERCRYTIALATLADRDLRPDERNKLCLQPLLQLIKGKHYSPHLTKVLRLLFDCITDGGIQGYSSYSFRPIHISESYRQTCLYTTLRHIASKPKDQLAIKTFFDILLEPIYVPYKPAQ